MAQSRRAGRGGPGETRPVSSHDGWKLEDAKSRFSELVRRARNEGPQHVTVRGADAVVVIAAEEFKRLLPGRTEPVPFVAFMESLSVDGLDLTREPDTGRDPPAP